MIKLDELTDDEVAMLLYSVEQHDDDVSDLSWHDNAIDVSRNLRRDLDLEYIKRGLYWSSYMKDI
jgi:hypothetical protein